MTRAELQENARVLARLRRDAAELAQRFQLEVRGLDAESPRVRRRYGICYADGTIRIRLRHVRTGQLLKYSALVDTLCHELAHLRHFDHGSRFQTFYRRILEHARRAGIYRPRLAASGALAPLAVAAPPSPPPPPTEPARTRPVQLDLFAAPRARVARGGDAGR